MLTTCLLRRLQLLLRALASSSTSTGTSVGQKKVIIESKAQSLTAYNEVSFSATTPMYCGWKLLLLIFKLLKSLPKESTLLNPMLCSLIIFRLVSTGMLRK